MDKATNICRDDPSRKNMLHLAVKLRNVSDIHLPEIIGAYPWELTPIGSEGRQVTHEDITNPIPVLK